MCATVIKDNTRLYLRPWEYNAAKILTRLAKIVEDYNGKVKPLHTAIISRQSLRKDIFDLTDRIERYEKVNKHSPTPERTTAILDLRNQLEKLEAIDDTPITVTHTTYIHFVLDGYYYTYSIDTNPFFPFYYSKTPVIDGSANMWATSEEDTKKEWEHDCFFRYNCSDASIVEAAYLIFNMLVNSKPIKSYHERMVKIDF